MVAVTGFGDAAHRESALAAGFDQYLLKPVEPELIRRFLEAKVEKARLLAELKDNTARTTELIQRSASLVSEIKELSNRSGQEESERRQP
jgi:CheY-like chemotaxis protein